MRAAESAVLVFALLFCLAGVARAGEVQDDCNWDKLRQDAGATDLRHPVVFFAVHKPMLDRGRWLDVVADAKDQFERSAPDSPERERFLRQVALLGRELEAVMQAADVEALRKAAQGVSLRRFRLTEDPERDVVYLFRRTPDEIVVDSRLSVEARRAYCWTAISLQRVLTYYGEEGRKAISSALRTQVARWDAFNQNGYLQFPWELYLNGKVFDDPASLAPPRGQLVVMHPGLAIEQAGSSLEQSRRHDVVSLEPIGFLWYTDSRATYYGLSALLTFASDEDAGRGVLLHFGKFAKIGYVVRDRAADGRRQNGVVLSMDLYQLLAGPTQSHLDREERVRQLLDYVEQPALRQ